jgi:hypothetical protein
VRYSGWPLPPEWVRQASAVAARRDGEEFEQSVQARNDRMMQEKSSRCWWCNKEGGEMVLSVAPRLLSIVDSTMLNPEVTGSSASARFLDSARPAVPR